MHSCEFMSGQLGAWTETETDREELLSQDPLSSQHSEAAAAPGSPRGRARRCGESSPSFVLGAAPGQHGLSGPFARGLSRSPVSLAPSL